MARRRRAFFSCSRPSTSLSAFLVWFQFRFVRVGPKLGQIWRRRLAGVVCDAFLFPPEAALFLVTLRRSTHQPRLFPPYIWLILFHRSFCVPTSASIVALPPSASVVFSGEASSSSCGDFAPPPSLYKAPTRSSLLSAVRCCDGEIPCVVGDQFWAFQRLGQLLVSWLLDLLEEKPFSPLSPQPIFPSPLRRCGLSLCPPLAILFFTCGFTGYFSGFFHRHTGYFSGSSQPASVAGHVCLQFRTTVVGSIPAQLRRRLCTGYFSGLPLPAFEAVSGCFQIRTTIVGSKFVLTSQEMVTTSLPVDVYVLIAISFIGVLVIVSFDTSPGTLSSFLKLVSLCLLLVCSCVLIFKLAIWVCPNMQIRLVSF